MKKVINAIKTVLSIIGLGAVVVGLYLIGRRSGTDNDSGTADRIDGNLDAAGQSADRISSHIGSAQDDISDAGDSLDRGNSALEAANNRLKKLIQRLQNGNG